MSKPLTLFLVVAKNEDGENLDLLVCAPSEDEARNYWVVHYEDFPLSDICWVGEVPGVTPHRPAGPILWEEIRPLTPLNN